MRQPDYRALPYAKFSNPKVELEYDVNNRYTAANQSQGYIHPFVDEVTAQSVAVRPAVPGLSMAGTGDLASIASSLFSPDSDTGAYQRIADSIRGGPVRMSESSPTRQQLTEVTATAELQPRFVPDNPILTPQRVSTQLIYGDASRSGSRGASSFPERCRTHFKGALYDLMHFEDITERQLEAAQCSHRLGFVATREGRLPYLAFLLAVLLAGVIIARSLWA